MSQWREVGPGNYVLGTSGAALNTGLVVGEERALVIDTGCGPRQANEILAAVREVTELPLVVVNTHAHFDHFFGNAVFAKAGVTEFWAHGNCAAAIQNHGEEQRKLAASVEPEVADPDAEDCGIVVPNRLVGTEPVKLDLGGSTATLFHLGPAHTDGDLLVGTEHCLFAGDIVEQGFHPSFEDSYPERWVDVLRHVSALRHNYEYLVPGHGEPVGDAFVRTMADTMATAVRSARQATREMPNDATKAVPILPYGPEQSRWFIHRLMKLHRGV
ncbi:MBL fold metallo-hydrolase [Paenarthrobacter sp. DKR-5]|uniref:MBL fold metallo-hydrolase n=1 Tax=Paenarthrobacter sp. DKR-5 TaxID=2835535 RepID=UPI001BDD6227|nr:MBL fold metallo-hydrolase [Paenarthrobacter sp. DKR-5]MBT1001249.1 MBL fold metallo-hydrolase [Paenarthrobacter sp. DKR-5]